MEAYQLMKKEICKVVWFVLVNGATLLDLCLIATNGLRVEAVKSLSIVCFCVEILSFAVIIFSFEL